MDQNLVGILKGTYIRKWDEDVEKAEKTPMSFKCYIDDGFGLWEHSIEELLQFPQHANQIHPNIKVELRCRRDAIEFLDTMVKVEDGALTTDLYTKPSDKHLYVNYKSCHPTHVKDVTLSGYENKTYVARKKINDAIVSSLSARVPAAAEILQ